MNLTLHNTLTGQKEEFKPLKSGEVSMYTCGPTVYNYAHIGNLRAYVFADVLRRTLEYSGYKVKQVMNVTDVGQLTSDEDEGEDKMVKGLKREGKPLTLEAMKELGEFYATAFINDLKALNVELPHEMPRASEHIAEDIELIRKLEAKGIAYKTSDGIYFDISQYPSYGTRGGFKLGDLQEGARVAVNTEKKNPRDFSLWKFTKPTRTNAESTAADGNDAETGLGFPSPWGNGFPGWHIECSAMSREYLGQPFDIHTGGIDHIPTHHQNEIAQSEAAYDVPLANYWVHNEHLNLGDRKMAKSGEDFITLQTLGELKIKPLVYRYYLLQAHYRSPFNLSHEALYAGNAAYSNLLRAFWGMSDAEGGMKDDVYKKKFEEAINDDLNTSKAIALLRNLLKDASVSKADKRATILDFDRVLGLDIENQSKKHAEEWHQRETSVVPEEIEKLKAAREDARRLKDFKKSDELRDQIREKGFEVEDSETGSLVTKKTV